MERRRAREGGGGGGGAWAFAPPAAPPSLFELERGPAPHHLHCTDTTTASRFRLVPSVTDMVPRFRLWPACRDVAVLPLGAATTETTPPSLAPPPLLRPTVQNLFTSAGERSGGTRHERTEEEEERGRRGSGEEARPDPTAEAVMLRGAAAGSKPHRRPRLRQRRESVAAAVPELKEAPVVASLEETSFTIEFKRGLKRAKKADSRSMDGPAGEGNSREGLSNQKNVVARKTTVAKQGPEQVDLTHCAPSIVARLMGLDTMPRTKKVLDRCQSDIQANRQRKLFGGVQEAAHVSAGDQPRDVGANELPALKDVFEVSEMENKVMNEVLQSGNKKPHLRSSEADLEFVRQKFIDVKRLSADEANRNSREFCEALEILHSKKDVFLEILQDNRTAVSGFSGNILNHSGLQLSSHTSAANATQSFEQEILCNIEIEHEGASDAITDSEEPTPSMLLEETPVTTLKPLEKEGSKSKGSRHRSHIVVLKPNLQRKSFTPVLSNQETLQYDRRNVKQHVKSSKQAIMHSAPNDEVSERGGTMIQRAGKQTPKSAGRRRSSEEECKLAVDIERVKVASTYHDSSTESSVSRKARKHLSEQWQAARQFGSTNSIPRDIKTLGEMLELSDRDAAKEAYSHKRSSDPILSDDNVRQVPANPLGISSKDGWKSGIYCEDHSSGRISRNFSRSKSLPASSTSSTKLSSRRQSASTCRLPILKDILNTPTDESESAHVKKRSPIRNAKQKNRRTIVKVGKENMLPEKEIHVASEKERHNICISDLPQAANTHTEYPDDIRSRDQQASAIDVQHEQQNSKCHMSCSDGKLTTPFAETEEDKSVYYQDIMASEEERNPSIEIGVAENDTEAIQCAHIASAESCKYSCPATLSQQSSGEYMSYSGIFDSINVGIQGLREQLKMLKTEDQDGTCGYYSDTFSSDECSSMKTSTCPVMEEQVPLFKDEEDRDFSYVQDMLDSVCDFPAYLADWQVSSNVFLWLENKYNKLLLWSKSDRRLLFDLVNSVIADMTAPNSNLHSKIMVNCLSEMDSAHLARFIWKMVQKQRYCEQVAWDGILPLPLDHHSELELIKMEVVKMIHDDIIKESIVEFVLKEN
ncbi:hypothetical protein PR202_ga11036 [Eleusine coracana subsp. coracana]|uniref:DUF3741 domain-containing protein n=1 Tax=Eleusine coracana subsp. coracana TaxID=191504 RepID=A0AAV5C8F3_ELECO|nr:hypothetical protein PR202_ga11036 [Eleusine coracana subsp. coracana]